MTRLLPITLWPNLSETPDSAYTVTLPADRAAELGLLPPPPAAVTVPAVEVGEAVGFRLYWCLMNVPVPEGYPAVPVRGQTINDSYGRYAAHPLALDLDAHREKLARDLAKDTGLGVMAEDLPEGSLVALDYEDWGPTLPTEAEAAGSKKLREQRDAALAVVRERYPDAGADCIETVAAADWQRAAAAFFEASIDVAKATRPELRWGFYYPQARHYWSGAYSGELGDQRRASNDVLAATWAKVDWFPVSVYWFYVTGQGTTKDGYGTPENNARYVRDNIAEWHRLAGNDLRPVIAMIEPHIHTSNRAFAGEPIPADDLALILAESRRAGADGLVLWGWVSKSDKDYAAKVEAMHELVPAIGQAYAGELERAVAGQEGAN